VITFVLALFLTTTASNTPDPATCPMHAEHMKAAAKADPDTEASHGAGVDHRHDTLGMSHDTTHHSFRLFADGGAIELRANDGADEKSVAAIRKHLREIADAFAGNDFTTPAFVHGNPPDGVAEMARLHDTIDYRYEDVATGARVRITTKDAAALAAIHEFLRFQVREHRTGDSGEMEK
jgi:hypothetical protein